MVITGSKLWAWSYGRGWLAIGCAVLSVLGNTMLFNAAMETQSKTAIFLNTQAGKIVDPLIGLQSQIDQLNKSNDQIGLALLKLSKEEPLTMQTLINTQKSNNALIGQLLGEQTKVRADKSTPVVIENKIILDAYLIMDQVASKFRIPVQWFGLFFMLGVSIILELIIMYTTPRQQLKTN